MSGEFSRKERGYGGGVKVEDDDDPLSVSSLSLSLFLVGLFGMMKKETFPCKLLLHFVI